MAGGIDDTAADVGAQAKEDAAAGAQQPAAPELVTRGAGTSSGTDYAALLAERDERIAELEAQVADAAKSAEAADALRGEIEGLRAQAESDRIEYGLRLAGARSVRAARAFLDEHGGDVTKLKEAEQWLFSDAPAAAPRGATGLPNASPPPTTARR